ncbi:hypothetical protein [Fodinibius sp. Rm-B-1B1-1]|uniref:hypothetical protein n=1 Tax=Fodinibius alkaliphilus TaxID=3140241 RepID=UPI00315A4635
MEQVKKAKTFPQKARVIHIENGLGEYFFEKSSRILKRVVDNFKFTLISSYNEEKSRLGQILKPIDKIKKHSTLLMIKSTVSDII